MFLCGMNINVRQNVFYYTAAIQYICSITVVNEQVLGLDEVEESVHPV